MNLLICGGAGYIGSHMAKWLATRGHAVTVLDNLSTGFREAVRWGAFAPVDLLDTTSLDGVFAAQRFDAVLHFAARSQVGESVREPLDYYQNNVVGSLNLLAVMKRHGVDRLVFSSTAAVYGGTQSETLDESSPLAPTNPYGRSKRMVEQMLHDAAHAYGLRSVALRYFNAAGASPDGDIGECHDPETHLIPNALRAALGFAPALRLFGTDYPTPDGTCVRDYVHVDDLAQAHALALDWMDRQDGAHVFNLGNGQGFSVRDVIDTVARISGRAVPFDLAPRRDGDVARLVASSERARTQLGWQPRHADLDTIVETAWRWHRDHPKGFAT